MITLSLQLSLFLSAAFDSRCAETKAQLESINAVRKANGLDPFTIEDLAPLPKAKPAPPPPDAKK